MKWLYLAVDLSCLSIPLIASYESRIKFIKQWPYFIPSLLVSAAIFILWDMIFTHLGVWGVNDQYVIGPPFFIYNLPIEEVLFYICIPYACVFIYEVTPYFIKKNPLEPYGKYIAILIAIFLLFMVALYKDRLYTVVTCLSFSIFIGLTIFVFEVKYFSRFIFSYILLLPIFLAVDSILTGSFIENEVIWYNPAQHITQGVFSIPIEDFFYNMFLVYFNVVLFEFFRRSSIRFT